MARPIEMQVNGKLCQLADAGLTWPEAVQQATILVREDRGSRWIIKKNRMIGTWTLWRVVVLCNANVGDGMPCRCLAHRGHKGLHVCEHILAKQRRDQVRKKSRTAAEKFFS